MIISIDPGGTSGVAILYKYDGPVGKPVCSDWDNWLKVAEMVAMFADSGSLDHVIYEDFIITQQTIKLARSYDALWLIGAIQYICTKYEVPFTPQKPSDRNFATTSKMMRMGWIVPGDHKKQAARHLLVWCWNQGMIEAKELVSGDS